MREGGEDSRGRSLLAWSKAIRRRQRPLDGCWSRAEQSGFYNRRDSLYAPSGAYTERLQAYQKMHQRCTADITNWEDFFLDPEKGKKDGADTAGCKYLLFQSPIYHGVGNRIMGLVSAFALALLTDRALLIEDREFLAQAFCNPFPESTWALESAKFNQVVGKIKNWVKNPDKNSTVFDLHISWNWTPWEDLCDERQQEEGTNRFGVMYTDFYVLPVYYLNPRFREALDQMFPDRRAFMHLGRYMLLPANHIWDRITRAYSSYLSHHNTKIGLQIRETKDTGVGLMANVFDCLVNRSRYLPDTIPVREWRELAANVEDEALRAFPGKKTAIFVTSLNGQHASLLHDRYTRGKPVDGSSVSVFSLSRYQKEITEDYSHYEAATVEMWLLSFCDHLLVTDYSTFGYVATGLSGIDPFMLNVAIRGPGRQYDWRENGRPSCVPAFSEPCLVADVYQKCPGQKKAFAAWDNAALQKCPGVGRFVMAAPQAQA